MAFWVETDVCEGIADCIPVCPTESIRWAKDEARGDWPRNRKGAKYVTIDSDTCSRCGLCLSVCPIEGAIRSNDPEFRLKTR